MASVFDSDEGIEEVFRHFIAEKQLINDDSPSIDIFDIDYFKARMASLTQAFPEEFFLHALALKGMKIETLKSRRNKKYKGEFAQHEQLTRFCKQIAAPPSVLQRN